MTNSLGAHEVLLSRGYKCVEDVWGTGGRVTYIHNEDPARQHVDDLLNSLKPLGWRQSGTALRTFEHPELDHLIEIEPGGADTSGHFLHYLRNQQRQT